MKLIAGLVVLFACTFAAAAWLTGRVRRVALARGILDTPNERSSHTQVMPRGGGVAIVAAALAAVLLLCVCGMLHARLALALIGGGLAIAAAGFLDDRGTLSPAIRLLVHVLAAVWSVYVLGGMPPLQIGERVFDLGMVGNFVAVVAIVWVVNLFNFMDGIDGIAASEAALVGGLGGVFAFGAMNASGVALGGGALAAAACGFLVWNWPPARIFMGDAGSGFLGFFIAVLALGAARSAPSAVFVWLALGGVFFVDATVTFVRRLLRGVRVYEAHREHAYQRLSRRWGSHVPVLRLTIAVTLFWLAPCAWYAAIHPQHAAAVSLLALAPLTVAVVAAGAGRPE